MENRMEQVAERFVNAIKTIAGKPGNLDNLECYLSHHLEAWVKKQKVWQLLCYGQAALILKLLAKMDV